MHKNVCKYQLSFIYRPQLVKPSDTGLNHAKTLNIMADIALPNWNIQGINSHDTQ